MSITVTVKKSSPSGSAIDVARALGQLRHQGRVEGLFFEMQRRRHFLNDRKDKKLRAKFTHKEKKFRLQNPFPGSGNRA